MPALRLPQLFRSALLLAACAITTPLLACPAGQQEICVVTCFCAPVGGVDGAEIAGSLGQLAASGLQAWLLQSRASLASGDLRGIPLHIRAQLEPYYDLQVLDTARYKVGDDAELNAANAMLQNPDVSAVTVIDIIVFRHAEDALDNVALWAHELKHVQQYQQWGVAEFAARYTRDYRAVEAPAYEVQDQVSKALRTGASR